MALQDLSEAELLLVYAYGSDLAELVTLFGSEGSCSARNATRAVRHRDASDKVLGLPEAEVLLSSLHYDTIKHLFG